MCTHSDRNLHWTHRSLRENMDVWLVYFHYSVRACVHASVCVFSVFLFINVSYSWLAPLFFLGATQHTADQSSSITVNSGAHAYLTERVCVFDKSEPKFNQWLRLYQQLHTFTKKYTKHAALHYSSCSEHWTATHMNSHEYFTLFLWCLCWFYILYSLWCCDKLRVLTHLHHVC